jgi:hypothetical protein
MLVLKPKNRILTLRLSTDDYQALRQASLRDGARSLSDYARDSLFRAFRTEPAAYEMKSRMTEFEDAIDSLKDAVRQLQMRVGDQVAGE